MPRFVSARLGVVQAGDGDEIEVDATFETMPSVLFDALIVPGFRDSTVLAHSADATQFIKDQYRHCKPILVLGNGRNLVESAGVKLTLPSGELDPLTDVHDLLHHRPVVDRVWRPLLGCTEAVVELGGPS